MTEAIFTIEGWIGQVAHGDKDSLAFTHTGWFLELIPLSPEHGFDETPHTFATISSILFSSVPCSMPSYPLLLLRAALIQLASCIQRRPWPKMLLSKRLVLRSFSLYVLIDSSWRQRSFF
jgi:hypothetical protein